LLRHYTPPLSPKDLAPRTLVSVEISIGDD
jgi:hypothetical protein